MLIGWMSGSGQDHSDYLYNFRLPGTSGSNFDFSPLDDSIAIAKTAGWNVLVIGYYNLSHYNKATEYSTIIERFENKDSSIVISFFKKGPNFDFDIKVKSGNAGIDEIIASEMHNYLNNNHSGFDGQVIINQIAKALSFTKVQNLEETYTETCTAGRSSHTIINSKFITSEDAFFISLSGVPILIPSGSKVTFFTCNASLPPSGPIPGISINAKGVVQSFEHKGKLYFAKGINVDGAWEFDGYKYSYLDNEGKKKNQSYFPVQTFNNGGNVFLVFVAQCEMLKIKEFEHINSIISLSTNKHAGPLVDVRTIYPNFVKDYRLQVAIDGNFKKVAHTTVVSEIEVTIDCPPPLVLDGIKLNEAIKGATYIEVLYDKSVTLLHTSLGKFALYDIVNSPNPAYMKYDEVSEEWVFIEVDDAVFTNQLRTLVAEGAKLGAKAAIFAATFAGSGGGVGVALAIDIFAAGAMYAIDGDPDNLVMDLLLVPLGAAAGAISLVKDGSKVADAMKDAAKFDDVTSGAYKGYRSSKGVKATKNFKIKNLDGEWLDWASIKPDLLAELGNDYAKFCDDFVEIAKNSGKHLDLLQCAVGSGSRGGNSGIRSGACNYKILKAWKLLAEHPQISTDISSIQAVAKLREVGIPDADVIKILDNVAKAGAKCKTCTNGNLNNKLFHEVLEDVEHGVRTYGTEFNKVLADIKKTNDQFGASEGAIYVADILRRHPSSFPVNSTQFEVNTLHGFIDIKVGGIFYELKNVVSLPPTDFGRQFARDLLDAQGGLTNIKWWFNKRKIDTFTAQNKTDMMNALKSHLDGLTEQQRNLIRQNHNLDSNSSQGIMNSVLDNFDTIFFNK